MPRFYTNPPGPLAVPGRWERKGKRDETGNDYVPQRDWTEAEGGGS